MPPKGSVFTLLIVAAGVVAGCATASKTPVYDRSQTGQIISEQRGEIVGVQDVVIKAPTQAAGSTGIGSKMGSAAVVSAVLGSPIHAAIAAGDVIGGIAGAPMDNEKGEELTIMLKDGRTVVVVQQRGQVPFMFGDRVKIMTGSGNSIYSESNARVVRDESIVNSR